MKDNITLIGMPGAGKSTAGVLLAKRCGLGFIDTDLRIQARHRKTLQPIIDEGGFMALRLLEEREILGLDVSRHVIATGGSAVYSDRAMRHLERMSTVVHIEVSVGRIRSRLRHAGGRGIAMAAGQSLEDLYRERQPLYRRYAEVTVDGNLAPAEALAEEIAAKLGRERPGPSFP